jgi:SAM-dependent methyltransferase
MYGWRVKLYISAHSVLERHPRVGNWLQKSHLFRTSMPFLFNFDRCFSDRLYMTENILPALALSKVQRLLFVGCREYTARYGRRLTPAGIDYWTTDIDPAAAVWGEKGRHIVCDVAKIDDACPAESFDAVLLNGVIGSGVDEESAMNRAVKAIARILRPNGILLIGWNSDKKHPDPTELESVALYFNRQPALNLPLRKTFPDTDHVYDWLVKTNATEADAARKPFSDISFNTRPI